MAEYANGIELWNAALVSLGEATITFNDQSAEDQLYRARFSPVSRTQLKNHATGFARKTEALVKQGTSGDTPEYVYQLPTDMLELHKVTYNLARLRRYELRGGKLLTDANVTDGGLVAHYTWNVPVAQWSDDFAEAMLHRCRQMIFTLHERHNDARDERFTADQMFLDAQARDRNAQPPVDREEYPVMVRNWRGGGRHGKSHASSS